MTAPLTDAQVAALREAAEKAQRGEWTVGTAVKNAVFNHARTDRMDEYVIAQCEWGNTEANAAHIAAVSPDVVLALLAERDALKWDRDRYRDAYERPFASWDIWNYSDPDAPEGAPQRYRVAATRHDGIQVLLRPIYLRDEVIAGAAKRAEAAEAALSALRARETWLREAMHAIYKGLSSEKDGEFWTAQKWCDDRDIYVENLQGLRVLEEVARQALSTPAVHGASEEQR